jgi:putative FmdB family regulatory protein
VPIYEYRCESCSHTLEKLQKMSDDMLVDCPECGQPALKRLVSAAGFRLKGSGWYETDFKKDNKRNLVDSAGAGTASTTSPSSDSSKASKPSADSSAKKSDTKPASKEKKHA